MAKILVLENDPNNANVIHLELTEQGHNVKTITTAVLLDITIEQFKPELIVMDVLLDHYDGRKLCKNLKSSYNTAHIPILLITAMMESEIYNLPVFANKVMLKPFYYYVLSDTVTALLSGNDISL